MKQSIYLLIFVIYLIFSCNSLFASDSTKTYWGIQLNTGIAPLYHRSVFKGIGEDKIDLFSKSNGFNADISLKYIYKLRSKIELNMDAGYSFQYNEFDNYFNGIQARSDLTNETLIGSVTTNSIFFSPGITTIFSNNFTVGISMRLNYIASMQDKYNKSLLVNLGSIPNPIQDLNYDSFFIIWSGELSYMFKFKKQSDIDYKVGLRYYFMSPGNYQGDFDFSTGLNLILATYLPW